MAYEERIYREYMKAEGLVKFAAVEKETDLAIMADSDLTDKALIAVHKYRAQLEKYLATHPQFEKSFIPIRARYDAPPIVRSMAWAARKARVGPMAAVAGAMAEYVGKEILKYSKEVIVENGGDIYLKIARTRKVGIFAGESPFSEKIALELDPRRLPFSVCTSSGTVGPSFSFGKADAVVIVADSASLADAAATAVGNEVKEVADIEKGLQLGKKIRGLDGILIIKGDQLGVLGKIKIVPI